ncbi:MAG: putative glycolipid-binding domain-containing protein [Methylobacterium mesophilicum]|nr:putative glycolipid-binding domain-containing protein [Methylobacterium mesophilicum]
MFQPLRHTRTVRWEPADGQGLEHCTVEPFADRIEIRSTVIGDRGNRPYGVFYRIRCDLSWRVLDFSVSMADGLTLALSSPEPGRWLDAKGAPLLDFDGCLDIDLAGTPFTNTLPVRRLSLSPDQGRVELEMLYVPFDSFVPVRDGQRYTCLRDRLYRYEAADRSFSAELPVDGDGLVMDYPGLFRRV